MNGGRRRTCVIGLDGVPHGLILQLTGSGVMPRLAELIESRPSGSLRKIRASLPEISSVSWSSFMTGVDPGTHGIFGFTDIDVDTYELRFPSFRDLQVDTLWDRLGARGLTSVVLNQPATYPARSIPGAIVSGFVAIDLAKSIKPLTHLAPLRRMGYRIDIDTGRCRTDHDLLFEQLDESLRTRREALIHLSESVDWDFLQIVVTGTDRLYHYLWDSLVDPSHPRHEQALDYHRAVDALIGEILDRLNCRERTWLLSDHGFCAIRQEVQLNHWLQENGYLEFDSEPQLGLETISGRSRAFALDPGRIYIHRRGRFARGSVAPGEAKSLMFELQNRLRELRYDGAAAIREVYDASAIYAGPRVPKGPDLVVLAEPGFDLKASPRATRTFDRTDLVGMHTYDDAFLLSPQPIDGDLWIGELAGLLERECERDHERNESDDQNEPKAS